MAGTEKKIQFLAWILKLKSLVRKHSNHRENLLIKGAFLQHFLYQSYFKKFSKNPMQAFVIGIFIRS